MTRAVSKLLLALGFGLSLTAFAAFAQAAESSAAPAAPDLKKGAAIAAAVCAACHAADGNGTGPVFPKLADQHPEYIVKELMNFKVVAPASVAERPNAIMSPIAAALSDADMQNVAAYYATQKLKPSEAKDKNTVALGKKIWRGGIAEKGVPACAACHGPTGAGIPIQYPRIGGQWQDYLYAQVTNFKSGTRNNNVPMATIAQRLSDDEMKAVTDYAAGLR